MATRSRRKGMRKRRSTGPRHGKPRWRSRASTRKWRRRRRVRSKTRRPRYFRRSHIVARRSGGAPEPMEIDDEEMEDEVTPPAAPDPILDMPAPPILRRAAARAAPTVPRHQALAPPTLAVPAPGTPIRADRTTDIARQAAAWQAAYEQRQVRPFTARFHGRQDNTQQGWWEQQQQQQRREEESRQTAERLQSYWNPETREYGTTPYVPRSQ